MVDLKVINHRLKELNDKEKKEHIDFFNKYYNEWIYYDQSLKKFVPVVNHIKLSVSNSNDSKVRTFNITFDTLYKPYKGSVGYMFNFPYLNQLEHISDEAEIKNICIRLYCYAYEEMLGGFTSQLEYNYAVDKANKAFEKVFENISQYINILHLDTYGKQLNKLIDKLNSNILVL